MAERLYLGNVVLQLVVLFDIEACPFDSLVKEQQILSVSGIWVNVLLQVRDTEGQISLLVLVYISTECDKHIFNKTDFIQLLVLNADDELSLKTL